MVFRWLKFACLTFLVSCPHSRVYGEDLPGFLSESMLASAIEPVAKIPAGALNDSPLQNSPLQDPPPPPPSDVVEEGTVVHVGDDKHVGDGKEEAITPTEKDTETEAARASSPIRSAAPPAELAPSLTAKDIAKPLQASSPAAEKTAPAVPPTPEPNTATLGTELVQERYPNGSLKIAREIIQDTAGNFIQHGAWKMWALDGVLTAKGSYKFGKRHGVWQRMVEQEEAPLLSEEPYRTFDAPFLSEASFQEGKLHGSWTIYDARMRKISQIDFQQGVRHGKARWWNTTGQMLREITFKEGLVDGELLQWGSEGQLVAKEIYLAGRRLTPKTDYFPNKKKKSSGAVLAPRIATITPDDWWNLQLAQFEADETEPTENHGAQIHWHPNGQVQLEGVFEQGQPTGEFTWWYANGQKAVQGSYIAGQQAGVWIWWGANGLKKAAGEFVGGHPVDQWTWWQADGKVSQRMNYSQEIAPHIAERPSDPLQTGAPVLR